MCVENVKAINESGEGVKVSVIVGDEDSSAIAHVREKVDSTVEKWSDINHVKKSLVNKLYELRKFVCLFVYLFILGRKLNRQNCLLKEVLGEREEKEEKEKKKSS